MTHKSLLWQLLYATLATITGACAFVLPKGGFVPMEYWSVRLVIVALAVVFVVQLVREMRG